MLVLSRKVGESISIGDGITVQVLRFEGNRIRLGVTAPEGVKILRSKILLETNGAKPVDRPACGGYDSSERKIAS